MIGMPSTHQIITWLVVGVLAGGLAGSLVRRKLYFTEILLAGLLGAVVGGIVISVLGIHLPKDAVSIRWSDLITAFIGAAIVIGFAEMIVGTRRHRD
jgi:uncharacterized membrane protein YeaQ/YmgE (transglycosylase-associated protein family)